MLGNIIGAVGGIIGGLIGGEESSKTKTKTRTRSTSRTRGNLKLMVREAERAGFNPLTVLRAGGLAAFSKTTSISNSKSKGKGSSSSSSPLGAGIAGAATSIGGALDEGANQLALNSASAWQGVSAPGAAAANQAEYDALQSQLKAVQPGALGTQPRVPVSAVEKADVPQLASNGAVKGIAAQKPEVERGKITNPLPGGIMIPDDIHSADDWESLLSEPGGWVGGFNNAYRIAQFNEWGVPQFKKDMSRFGTWGAQKLNEAKERIMAPVKESDYRPSTAVNPNAIWDPPAITMGLPPVIETKPVPDLYRDPFPAFAW